MARILRIALAEDVPEGIDLGMPGPGKILIQNSGANDCIVGYDRADVLGATAVSYYTIDAGLTLMFDTGPEIGFLAQNQLLWFASPSGDTTVEIWVADGR